MKNNNTFFIITIGCQMNKADSERISGLLKNRGFNLVSDSRIAQFVIINTCGVRQSAEDRVYGLVNQIKLDNEGVKIVVTGCLSYRADVKRRLIGRVELFLPTNEIPQLPELLLESVAYRPYFSLEKMRQQLGEKYLQINADYQSSFSAYLPIGNGCNNFCSYCVVPYARGRETYRPAREIISEARSLIKAGYQEIVLIAQNVNSYQDKRYNFPKLLRRVSLIPGKFWLRFSSSHPKDLSDELINVIGSSNKICRHLHLAVQSGDNKILRAMNRNYTVAHYRKLIEKVRAVKPGIAITTDVIVGFPGESKEQFNNTVSLFRDINFNLAYIAQYSPRPGTASAKLHDNVLINEKKRRAQTLNDIVSERAQIYNSNYLGKKVEVLVDGRNKKGKYYGKSSDYITVVFVAPVTTSYDLIGKFVNIHVTAARPFGLEGKLI